jgi:3-hydroxybutyrate dehydrogenase
MGDLDGKVALVTGGGRGIGRAIVFALTAAGAEVAAVGRNMSTLSETCAIVAQGDGRAVPMICNVADPQAIQHLFGRIQSELGPVDILVNNAGITTSGRFVDTDDSTWNRIMQVNANGPFYCCRAAVPDMLARRWGRIINIASIAALHGLPFSSAYSASKHALLGLTRSLALELGRQGINTNAICPGWVETDMLHQAIETIVGKTGRTQEQARASVLELAGQQRIVTPEEVAAEVLRLAGPAGDGINGEAITVI